MERDSSAPGAQVEFQPLPMLASQPTELGAGRGRARRAPMVPLLAMLSLAAPVSLCAEGEVPGKRQSEILYLLRHDCGACHGLQLTGGLGPPLTVAALDGKPTPLLEQTILLGRAGTPMPPWRGILAPPETAWLVKQLKAGLADGK
ncbi:MAG: c-type cytochrome [Gammaproteobacteria bacterium]